MFDIELNKNLPKPTLYEDIYLLMQGMLRDEKDVLANLANISSLLYHTLPDVNWVGFYRIAGDELILGPFNGKPACIRIAKGQGVCGKAFEKNAIQNIADIGTCSDHIACDRATQSEIVLPLQIDNTLVAVLDIDSPLRARFDHEDEKWLSTIVCYIVKILDSKSEFWLLQ